jgi:hypothetical protein
VSRSVNQKVDPVLADTKDVSPSDPGNTSPANTAHPSSKSSTSNDNPAQTPTPTESSSSNALSGDPSNPTASAVSVNGTLSTHQSAPDSPSINGASSWVYFLKFLNSQRITLIYFSSGGPNTDAVSDTTLSSMTNPSANTNASSASDPSMTNLSPPQSSPRRFSISSIAAIVCAFTVVIFLSVALLVWRRRRGRLSRLPQNEQASPFNLKYTHFGKPTRNLSSKPNTREYHDQENIPRTNNVEKRRMRQGLTGYVATGSFPPNLEYSGGIVPPDPSSMDPPRSDAGETIGIPTPSVRSEPLTERQIELHERAQTARDGIDALQSALSNENVSPDQMNDARVELARLRRAMEWFLLVEDSDWARGITDELPPTYESLI